MTSFTTYLLTSLQTSPLQTSPLHTFLLRTSLVHASLLHNSHLPSSLPLVSRPSTPHLHVSSTRSKTPLLHTSLVQPALLQTTRIQISLVHTSPAARDAGQDTPSDPPQPTPTCVLPSTRSHSGHICERRADNASPPIGRNGRTAAAIESSDSMRAESKGSSGGVPLASREETN